MIEDIVKRLREWAAESTRPGGDARWEICTQAADEIERLRKYVEATSAELYELRIYDVRRGDSR